MEPERGKTLRLHGILDDEKCDSVRGELAPALAAGLRHLVLDLAGVPTLSPSGVAMLRGLDRHLHRLQGGLVLLHPTPEVLATLRIHDLQHLLEVRDLEPPVIRARQPAAEPRPRPGQVAGVIPLVRRA